MIYVVTVSETYYPEAGAGDWELVTRDLEAAKQRARAKDAERYEHAYLLAIDEDNLHVSEVPFK